MATATCTIVSRLSCDLRAELTVFHSAVTQTYDEMCGFLVIGWALHYLPFFLMARQLFLHHYFPALWFAIMTFCAVFDLATRNIHRYKKIQAAGVIVILAVWAYAHFSPLTYGDPWTRSQCEKSKWLRTWDFSWWVVHEMIARKQRLTEGCLQRRLPSEPARL